MNFEDAKKIWNEQPAPPASNATSEAARLARVRENVAGFERTYRRKDYSDVIIVLFTSATMTWIACVDASPLRILSALAFLPIPACLLVSRWKNRHTHTQPGDDLKHAVASALARLRHRRDLQRIYIWICIGSLLCARSLSWLHYRTQPSASEQQPMTEAAFILAVAAIVFLGNRTHIKTKLDPQIADLEEQQRTFLSNEKPAS